MVPRGPVALEGPGLMSQVSCPTTARQGLQGSFLFDGTVVNRSGVNHSDANVTVAITPPGGGTAITRTVAARELQPSESARLSFSIPVPDPALLVA